MILLIVRYDAMMVCADANSELIASARIRVVLFDYAPIVVAADCTTRCVSTELVQTGLFAALVIVRGWSTFCHGKSPLVKEPINFHVRVASGVGEAE